MDFGKWITAQWDRALALAFVALGALALILGWVGVSGHGYLITQMPYVISGGIGGIFLLGLGAMFWISSDLRDEWQKLDRIEQRLAAQAGGTGNDGGVIEQRLAAQAGGTGNDGGVGYRPKPGSADQAALSDTGTIDNAQTSTW